MISNEQVAHIRHLFHAEHWKVGTIAAELHLHPDTVRIALDTDRFRSHPRLRDRLTDPYLGFLRQTLQQYPRLRATRLFHMIRPRGYTGSITQLRRVVAELRPPRREAFLRLHTFPGEQAQADWAHFGEVAIGRARRRLSGFVLTSSATFTPSRIGVERRAASKPTISAAWFWSAAAMPSTSIPASWNSRPTTTSPPGPAARRGAMKRAAWSAPFSMLAAAFSQRVPSLPWLISIAKLSTGATKSPISAVGPGMTHASSPKLSRKRNRTYCLFPLTLSPAS